MKENEKARHLKSVLHLIPRDTIGGVEMAAKSIESGQHGELGVVKYFMSSGPGGASISGGDIYGPPLSLNNPLVFFTAIVSVLRRKPDLLVASLWRSVMVMVICKLLRPRLKVVVFLHSTRTAHFIDWIINAIGMFIATEVWTDSVATLNSRLWPSMMSRGKVVSFLLDRVPEEAIQSLRPNFIFWGRLRQAKDVLRSLKIFQEILASHHQASFKIIGPDGGDECRILDYIRTSGLESSVRLVGAMQLDEIIHNAKFASFYLQTSKYEGMSISVVEAMQIGLIPVVTPVGEIARYCIDDVNAVLIRNDQHTVSAVSKILSDPRKAQTMAKAAVETWNDVPLYREDFLRLSGDLVAR